MTAADIASLIPGVRETRPGKYEAPCTVHGGRSRRSLVWEQKDDLILMTCRAGCNTQDVLVAIGLKMKDLFSDQSDKSDPEARRRVRAGRGLEAWRQAKLTRLCELLRRQDSLAADINAYIQAFPDEDDSEEVWNSLETGHGTSTFLEHDFERLN